MTVAKVKPAGNGGSAIILVCLVALVVVTVLEAKALQELSKRLSYLDAELQATTAQLASLNGNGRHAEAEVPHERETRIE